MNGFLDGVLVGLMLLAGFGYSIYALGPKSLRARLLTGAATLLGRAPGLRSMAERLAAASSSGAACGGCGTCGSKDATAQTATGSDVRPRVRDDVAGMSEVRVPLTKIGRRR